MNARSREAFGVRAACCRFGSECAFPGASQLGALQPLRAARCPSGRPAAASKGGRSPFLSALLLAAFLVPGSTAAGADATNDPPQSALFTAGQGGYHTYRIPSLIVTRRGTLLAFCEGRKNRASDTGDIDFLLRRSTDGGRSWDPPQLVWDDAGNTCGNPCPVVDESTGTIWLLLTHNPGDAGERQIKERTTTGTRTVWVSRSDDDGRTWSRPVDITRSVKRPAWAWYATGPGVGIQVRYGPHAGRLVIPCDHSYPADTEHGSAPATDGGSHVIYSDDHGQTWQLGGTVRPHMNECQVVELSDGQGTLLLNLRTFSTEPCRAQSISRDGGLTWTRPRFVPELVEPRCQASLLRYDWPGPNHPGHILFANPAGPRRTRLTVRLSTDDARTWPAAKVLHPGPAAYSCLAVLPDSTVACLYERGDHRPYQTITFTRFSLGWVNGTAAE